MVQKRIDITLQNRYNITDITERHLFYTINVPDGL